MGMNKGLVIKNTGSWYHVQSENKDIVLCKLRGNFRLKGIRSTNPIAVGDKVGFILQEDGAGVIQEIEERKNYIIRKSSNLSKASHILAANIDLCFLVVTVVHPETSTTFIDRFIATAEAYRIPVCLVVNKTDLYDEDNLAYAKSLASLYDYIGYSTVLTSVVSNEGIEDMREKISNKVVLFSGNSGVGKTSLINAIFPHAMLKTGIISDSHHKGKHTTTFSEMVELPNNAYLIDTPGVKGFGLYGMEREEISHYFRDIFHFSKGCKFNNCMHINEPNCAVLEAIENQEISTSRYKSYLSMLDEDVEEKYRGRN